MYPVWGTWKLPPGMCSDYWHHSRTSDLQSLEFYTFSVALDWHWHTLDILCINIIRYLLLYFSYRCVLWIWIQKWYCIFNDVHLMNRLLLSRLLVYFILPYICNNIFMNLKKKKFHQHLSRWLALCQGWKFDIFRTIMQVTYLSSSGYNRNWLMIFFVSEFSYIM